MRLTSGVMGMEGAGEAGTIGTCPTLMNAMVDAFNREYRIRHSDMPLTPGFCGG